MGAGCYYTNENGSKAFWVEIDPNYEAEDNQGYFEELSETILFDFNNIFESLGYESGTDLNWYNGLFEIRIEPTYNGDAHIIHFNELHEERNDAEQCRLYNLAKANHERSYKRVLRKVNEDYPINFATSGYTSGRYEIGDLK